MIAKIPATPVKRTGFKPKSLLGLSISLLMWQPPGWADTLAAALPQLNEESTPKVGFDTQLDGNKLTVNQSADKVILNWDSFNIGEQNAVHFQQVANGIALNKILDQSPSQILGSLTSTGSIYLLNPNGVLFGQNSQVHVGNLLVSTLKVDEESFLKSNINNAIDQGKPALTAPGQAQGSIDIEKGAHISTESGGSVLVFAPSITNAGNIRTPDGQTVLAASQDRVYLTSSDQDPDLRGVFVEVGTGGDVTNLGEIVAERGNVTLMGLAVNQEGRVRATSSVDVNGTIRLLARDGTPPSPVATLAENQTLQYGVDSIAEAPKKKAAVSTHTGALNLGANSLTEVSLEQPPQAVLVDESILGAAAVAQLKAAAGSKNVEITDSAGRSFKGLAVTPAAYAQWQQANNDSPRRVQVLSAEGYIDQLAADRIQGATAVDASVQNPSKIELYGKHIDLAENAQVAAKGGAIKVVATDGVQPMVDVAKVTEASIHLAKGASLDVSGAEVTLGMERNSLEVEVRGNEVRDQPLQRDGVLRGKKVLVDARAGTAMVDIQGSLEKQAKSVQERSTHGGSISLLSEGYVDLDANSQVNIAGGKVNYNAGELRTTGLVKEGKVVDISAADPSQVYEDLTTLSHFEAGYTDVQDAGRLLIEARNAQMDATLKAGQAPGARQLTTNTQPHQGTLTLNLNHFQVNRGESVWLSPLRPEGMDLERETWLNPQLISAAGLSQLDLFIRGSLTQERGGDINLAAGGKFTAYAQDVLLAGRIDAAGGEIDISTRPAYRHSKSDDAEALRNAPGQHSLELLPSAELNVSGNWVNRSELVEGGKQAVSALDGGTISVKGLGDLRLDAGANLSADAGGVVAANNGVSLGKGGALNLQAAYPNTAVDLVLDATLSAQGFGQNGSLSLNLPELQIGRGEAVQTLKAATLLDYDFFARGGFSKYAFTTNLGGADILPQQGKSFNWQQRNWVLADNSYLTAASSRSAASQVNSALLPDYLRKPVSFSLMQKGVKDFEGRDIPSEGYIHVADGVDWQFDPKASVKLSGLGRMYIGGAITAPGGSLDFTLDKRADAQYPVFNPAEALWLGHAAWLSVAGITQNVPSDPGLQLGRIVDAGSITLTAKRGRLVSEEGSGLDLSAAAATFDVMTATGYQRQTRAGNAGTLTLALSDGLIWQSHLNTTAHTDLGAAGATVSVEMQSENALNISPLNVEKFPALARGIDVYSERKQDLLDGLTFGDDLPTHLMLIDGEQAQTFGRAILFADDLIRWQLGTLALNTTASHIKDVIERDAFADISFKESFDLNLANSLILDTQDLQLANDVEVSLTAPWMSIGEKGLNTPASPGKALYGSSFLTLASNELELAGNLRVSGAEQTTFFSTGSILAHGVVGNAGKELAARFESAGNISLIASVLYPGTYSNFTIASTAPNGSVEVASNGQPTPKVLSAGGNLSIDAHQIELSGAVSAPFGEVSLNGDDIHLASNALVNVSGDGQLIPLGSIIGNDLDWIYSIDPLKSTQVVSNTPLKQVSIKGERILMDEGSRINLAGGGDLLGYQFAPGPTGSKDVLAVSSPTEGFALLPAGNLVAYDSALQGEDGIATGSRITLSNNPLLPAGDYYLLPSRYALLPGAYWVKPTGKLQAAGESYNQPDGGVTLAGQLGVAFTQQHSADWQGFTFYKSRYDGTSAEALAPNGMANYKLRQSDAFFSQRDASSNVPDAANLPHAADAGSLVLDAQKALRLSSGITGQVRAGEMGARVDILGEEIHLVKDGQTEATDGLNLLASDLSKLNVGSTLIGGARDDEKPGHIAVSAKTVSVEQGAQVSMPAVLMVAKEGIAVNQHASITATATGGAESAEVISLDQPAALLRVAGSQAQLEGAALGRVDLAQGAHIKGNALLAAAAFIDLNSTLDLAKGGALSLSSANIQVGGVKPNSPAATAGSAATTDSTSTVLAQNSAGSDSATSSSASSSKVSGAKTSSSPVNNWLYLSSDFFASLGLQNIKLTAAQQLRLADGLKFSAGDLSLAAQTIERAAGASGAEAAPVTIKADRLTLSGTAGGALAPVPAEGSKTSLTIDAKQIYLGNRATEGKDQPTPSALTINGFNSVRLSGANGITGLGSSALSVAGDLDLTGNIGTLQLGALSISASGALATHQGEGSPSNTSLGGSIQLSAAELNLASRLQATSGQVHLASTGALNLLAGASIDVAGVSRQFGDHTLYTPGGVVSLTSQTGDISMDKSAQILFGATAGHAAGGGAGALNISAAQGKLQLAGSLNAQAPGSDAGGALALDANNLGELTALSQTLAQVFNSTNTQRQLSLRQRTGDLTLGAGASFAAGLIELTADKGAIDLAGSLLTPAGKIGLWAQGDINLAPSARLVGQNLWFSSLNGAITAGASSQLVKSDGAKPAAITLTAGEQGLIGSQLLADTQGWTLNAELWLQEEVAPEGVSIAQLDAMNAKAEAFLAANPGLYEHLSAGQNNSGGVSLHAELFSVGDISLAGGPLDLSQWRLGKTHAPLPEDPSSSELPNISEEELAMSDEVGAGASVADTPGQTPAATPTNQGRAGRLTLRAGGNINLDYSLSDGFTADTSTWGSQFVNADGLPLDALMNEDSSHINLVSGADLSSSNVLNTLERQGDAGSLKLANDVTVRTGTGDINIATQGNLELADGGTATIYTAGKTQMRAYAGSDELLPDYGSVNPYTVNEYALGSLFINKVYYPEAGGDITIRTGGDIQGPKSHQLVNEWLHRAAGTFVQAADPVNNPSDETNTVTRNITTWGIGFQDFNQGIASLGGGNLAIHSGGSINDLAVSSANTGKAVGQGLNNQVQQSVSGAVSIAAAGDINSGRWYSANNRFEVASLGNMGNTAGELAAVIGLGDAPVTLTATGNLAVEAVFNPTQLNLGYRQFSSNEESAIAIAAGSYQTTKNLFSTYGSDSALNFTSLAGNVSLISSQALKLQSYTSTLKDLFLISETDRMTGLNLTPGSVSVQSFGGDINFSGGLLISPQKNSHFELVANGAIIADKKSTIEINQLDASAENFGTVLKPLTATVDPEAFNLQIDALSSSTGILSTTSDKAHSAQSVYEGDVRNNWIYTASGDIAGIGSSDFNFVIASAKGLDLLAGRDLADTTVIFHHQNAAQHSSITTGRNVEFHETRDISNQLKNDVGKGILVLGPGSLRVQAGKDISLGTSDGIQSVGQGETDKSGVLMLLDPYLPDKAADLFISAGVNKTPNYSGVIAQYLATPSEQGTTFLALIDEAAPERLIGQINLLLTQPVKTLAEARSQFALLPLWQQQQVALGATRFTNTAAAPNYSRELVSYVTSANFDALALQNALNAQLGSQYEGSQTVQTALAALPIEQQHAIALKALGDGSNTLARNFLDTLVLSEIRQGGEAAIRQGLKKADPEGYERGYAALAKLYPGIAKDNNPWPGRLAMDNTKIRTSAEADINILLPGGNFEVGLETPTLSATSLAAKGIGLVVGSYGDINVAAAGSINVNKSRIFNLGGGDVMIWSSYGDVDAGKGAKTALSVPPPKVQIDPNTGASRLVFPPAVAGSGIQATNPAPTSDPRAAISDGADVLLLAPSGTVDAGDAGISSTGNILVGAEVFANADNIGGGGSITINAGSDSSVALPANAGTVGNDAAQSAEKAADNATGSQKEEKKLAYLTIELLGSGSDDEDEDEEEKRKKRTN